MLAVGLQSGRIQGYGWLNQRGREVRRQGTQQGTCHPAPCAPRQRHENSPFPNKKNPHRPELVEPLFLAQAVTSVAMAPDGERVASASEDGCASGGEPPLG